jgi:hypothetical protein
VNWGSHQAAKARRGWLRRLFDRFKPFELPVDPDRAVLLLIVLHGWPDKDVLKATLDIARDREELHYQAALAAQERAEKREAKAQQDKLARTSGARALWLHGKPITGTPAEAYLRGRDDALAAMRKC